MDSKETSQPHSAPSAPNHHVIKPATPVMDVVPPPAASPAPMHPDSRPGDLVINADGELKPSDASLPLNASVPTAVQVPAAAPSPSVPQTANPDADSVQEAPAEDALAIKPSHQPKSEKEKPTKPAPQPKPIKPPKQPGAGLGLAIAATVIIVLVLSGLAVFAYLQTK